MKDKTILQEETAVTTLPPLVEIEEVAIEKVGDSIRLTDVPETKKGSTVYLIQKRILDFLGALLGLLLLSPLLLILAIIIKLGDKKAPIFFSQERVGMNSQPFKMYKFRSMVVDAEQQLDTLLSQNESTGAMFKMANDPRVTRIGKFIRKTSLDELPQLWNVLKGDMSLVGPRPPLPREVMMYEESHFQRLTVKPGCTGIWQVTARNEVGFEEMVNLDILYIEERNLWLDIKLILKTIQVMILKKGI